MKGQFVQISIHLAATTLSNRRYIVSAISVVTVAVVVLVLIRIILGPVLDKIVIVMQVDVRFGELMDWFVHI